MSGKFVSQYLSGIALHTIVIARMTGNCDLMPTISWYPPSGALINLNLIS